MNSISLTYEADLEQKNQKYFRILLLLAVPAIGFLSAAAAYIGFFKLESYWPFLVLPPSVLVVGLLLFEGLSPFFTQGKQLSISLKMLNRTYLFIIIYFSGACIAWFYYLLKFIEIHK